MYVAYVKKDSLWDTFVYKCFPRKTKEVLACMDIGKGSG